MLHSHQFEDGQAIPAAATCDGGDHSPDLEWRGAPAGTRGFCLVVTDPDAPGGTFTHWLLLNLPVSTNHLAAGSGVPGFDGRNDFGKVGYGGPCPPSGTHHYRFTLYALDMDQIGPSAGQSRGDLEMGIRNHLLGQTTLTGTYQRK